MRGRRLGAAAGVAIIVAGAGWGLHAATADGAPHYRLVAASTGDVEQTLALSGTLERASSADLSFTTSGTISKLAVSIGSTVKSGDVLARLDTTVLKAAVTQAEARVASAKAQLASDKQAQVDAAEAEADAAAAKAKAAKQAKAAATRAKAAAAAAKAQAAAAAAKATQQEQQLAGQQKAVTDAQTAATTALDDAKSALAAQGTACAADPTAQSCTEALASVQGAQQKAQDAQQELQKALSALAGSLGGSTQGGEAGQTGQGQSGQSAAQSGGTTGSGGSGVTAGTGGRTVTAADLANDQASIDSAQADLVDARQDLEGAVITAPFSGTIASLTAAKGDTTAAGTAIGVLLGSGQTTVEVSVSATQAAKLAIGQAVDVTPAGADKALTGQVTRVSHVAASSTASSGTTTYPVLITLADSDLQLPNGTPASVTVVIGTAEDVLTVPTSAVTGGTVRVVKDGEAVRTRVTTGTVGATRTEITDGLAAGAQVVLADLDAELPTSSTSSTTRGFGGGATFGGGGLGGPGASPGRAGRTGAGG